MKEAIREKALELGFDVCGFAVACPLEHLRNFYRDFIDEGRQASIDYLKRYAPQRLDPEVLMPGVKTIIAFLINYYPPELIPSRDNFIISKYAYGRDYPPLIKNKLEQLVEFFNGFGRPVETRIFVDSGPVLEKAWAQRCGIGWQGKNTVIINPWKGSFFFIGIILTDLEIEPDKPAEDHCGTCTKCMDACPAGAIDQPYRLNISRCISYRTIVDKSGIPDDIRSKTGGWIYGCDICQDVCPFNRFSKPTSEVHFHPSEALKKMRRNDWINLSKEKFSELFAGSAVRKTGYERFIRNVRNNK